MNRTGMVEHELYDINTEITQLESDRDIVCHDGVMKYIEKTLKSLYSEKEKYERELERLKG